MWIFALMAGTYRCTCMNMRGQLQVSWLDTFLTFVDFVRKSGRQVPWCIYGSQRTVGVGSLLTPCGS